MRNHVPRNGVSQHLCQILALSLLCNASMASAADGYYPQAQINNHAVVASVFQANQRCESELKREDGKVLTFYSAAEDLITQLIGTTMPAEPIDSRNTSKSWSAVENLRPSDRQLLAAKIYEMQTSFAENKSKKYAFGNAIRGEAAIRKYAAEMLTRYGTARESLSDAPKTLRRKDRLQTIKSSLQVLAGSAIAMAVGNYAIQYNLLLGFMSMTPFLFSMTLPMMRFTSYYVGDERYRAMIKNLPNETRMVSDMQNLTNQENNLPGYSFYDEHDISITAAALQALRSDQQDVAQELKQSCVVHAVSRRCEEYTAFLEAYNMNDHGYIDGAILSIKEKTNNKQNSMVIKGKLVTAYFHESKTNEPIWATWISFDLDPINDGVKKPKPLTQKQTSPQWTPGLQPAGN